MTRHKLHLTAEDIAEAVARCGQGERTTACPLAICCKRYFGRRFAGVSVRGIVVLKCRTSPDGFLDCGGPDQARLAGTVAAFDRGDSVKPYTFVVEEPDAPRRRPA